MKKWFNRSLWQEIGVTTCFFFAIEILFRVLMQYEIIDYSVIRVFLSCFLISVVLLFLTSFIKKKRTRERIVLWFLFIVTIYSFLQIGFKNYLGLYISFGASSQVGAVKTYMRDFFESYKLIHYLIWLPFCIYIVYYYMPKKWGKQDKTIVSWKNKVVQLGVIAFLCGAYYATLVLEKMQNPIQIVPNQVLIKNPTSSAVAVNQFGTVVYAIIDLKQLIIPTSIVFEEPEIQENEEITRN